MRIVKRPVEMAQQAVARRPVAVVLGIGKRMRASLEVIPVIRAVWSGVPVIVIADEDSLELERRARQAGIFYYFVHPLDRSEVEAVLKDVVRCSGGSTGGAEPGSGLARSQGG